MIQSVFRLEMYQNKKKLFLSSKRYENIKKKTYFKQKNKNQNLKERSLHRIPKQQSCCG
jgi:hypothetical protein